MENQVAGLVENLDSVKQTAQNGAEFWMARDILPHLGYTTWENFSAVIEKAKIACDGSGAHSTNHFRDVTKKIEVGKGAMAERADCYLSRYACYMIAMNGDPRKVEIATAQTYFAVQARLQEKQQDLDKRLELRERITNSVYPPPYKR